MVGHWSVRCLVEQVGTREVAASFRRAFACFCKHYYYLTPTRNHKLYNTHCFSICLLTLLICVCVCTANSVVCAHTKVCSSVKLVFLMHLKVFSSMPPQYSVEWQYWFIVFVVCTHRVRHFTNCYNIKLFRAVTK